MSAPTNTLPRWAYLVLALACMAMGFWASYITLEYFEHGAKALETDPALQALAVAAALMFVASEMGSFGLAALLTERQLMARRRMLTGFAVAVLLLEVWTIVAVQMALTSGADLAQTTVQTREKDLRTQIAAIEADAAAKRATAEQQRTKAKNAWELHLAGKSGDKAAAEQAKTAALYDELKTVQAQKRPTLSGLMGPKTALFYAVVRGVLVSMGGWVFFGVAGALLRAARGGVLSVDQQILALLHELRGTPGAPAAPALQLVKPAPAEPTEETPAPAAKAPARAREDEKPPFGFIPATSKLVTKDDTPVIVDTPRPVIDDTPVIDTPVIDDTPAPRQRAPRAPRERGEIMDAGTGEHDGHRFRRAFELIKTGKARPSQSGLYEAVRASRPVADRYLAAWAAAGEIVPNPNGAGWVLSAKNGGAA